LRIDGGDFVSMDRAGDRAQGLAGFAYGGNALFLAGFYDGVWISGDVELDLFRAGDFGLVGDGDSAMAAT
jgi:hypothetical protein